MNTHKILESFLPIRRAAIRLGVPAAWLRAEIAAGRISHLRVGRRVMIHTETVERELLHRVGESDGVSNGKMNADDVTGSLRRDQRQHTVGRGGEQ